MPRIQRTVTVFHRQGLHARPAALFVQRAKRYRSHIIVRRGRKIVDGKSIMGLLTLAAKQGSRISIVADGGDAREVLPHLVRLVSGPLPVARTSGTSATRAIGVPAQRPRTSSGSARPRGDLSSWLSHARRPAAYRQG